jgi:hypothetical protein
MPPLGVRSPPKSRRTARPRSWTLSAGSRTRRRRRTPRGVRRCGPLSVASSSAAAAVLTQLVARSEDPLQSIQPRRRNGLSGRSCASVSAIRGRTVGAAPPTHDVTPRAANCITGRTNRGGRWDNRLAERCQACNAANAGSAYSHSAETGEPRLTRAEQAYLAIQSGTLGYATTAIVNMTAGRFAQRC